MKKLILFVAIWVPVPAGNSWADTCRTTRSDNIHPLKMLIWMILLIGIGLPKSALANCEGTGPCYCTPGTAVCTNTPPPNNSSGGSSSSGGYTPQQQQILLQGAASLGNAIGQALRGNPEEDARRQAEQAAQAAEAKRQAAIQERQKEEARDRLLGKSQSGNASSGLSLMGVEHSPDLQLMTGDESVSLPAGTNPPNNTATPVKHTEAFTKGFQDASQCYSQNAGSRCAGIYGDQFQACLSDYRSGYQVGDKQRQQVLDEATRAGRSASGLLDDSASDPRALGPCRTQWIEAYNRGYFQGKQAKAQH